MPQQVVEQVAMSSETQHPKVNFNRIASHALANSESIVRQWLPNGCREGAEWTALNPKRADRRRGSFRINLNTGRWGDFAAGASGGDLISLAAYLADITQVDAARRVAAMLGIEPHG